MTGPEHYKMAESLVKIADEGSVDWESTVATAQVHAILALAAATALDHGFRAGLVPLASAMAWAEACAAPKDDEVMS